MAFTATVANAAPVFFTLQDATQAALSATFDYGLRLDDPDGDGVVNRRVFSFNGGPSAFLSFDDAAGGDATISGFMTESLSKGNFGNTYAISYTIKDIQLDLGTAEADFISTSLMSSGSLTQVSGGGNEVIQLGAAALKNSPFETFIFKADGHKVAGSNTAYSGRGWTDVSANSKGANDFVFTTTDGPTPGTPPAVPLPAAGWMLIAGVAGLGFAGRRKRKTS
ncbi:MAG: VPLPA-CTERM sorting domain-containing protein [Pseudomonadota bacterium]